MNQSVQLIVSKIEELIVAVGGKVEAFYPYVVRQVVGEGVLYLVGLVISIIVLVLGIRMGIKGEWEDCAQGISGLVLTVMGSITTIVLLMAVMCEGILQIINPHYYAIQRILEIGQGLLK